MRFLSRLRNEASFAFNLLSRKQYSNLVGDLLLVSTILFFALTLFFEISRQVFLNYYLKERIDIVFFGFGIIVVGAFLNGVVISYLCEKFRFKGKTIFIALYSLLFIAFYYFMLAQSVFSFFAFIEMNEFLYVLINSFTLYFTLGLSAFLLSHVKELLLGDIGKSGSGIIAALFSLGCPSCGALLWSLAGVAGFAAFLPFGGLELRVASLLLLIWALHGMYNSFNFKDKKVELDFKIKNN